MNVQELKDLISDAANAKERSDDSTFAEMLQLEIEALLAKIVSVMGKPIDDLKETKKVPHAIEEAANLLTECYSV